MKKSALLALGLLSCLAACRSNQSNDIVKSTYIHKYGVPISHDEWKRQGEDGKVVLLHKNGVTSSRSYSEGVLHGESTYTFPNTSTLAKSEIYEKGMLVARKENYISGVPHLEEDFEDEVICRRSVWYENGSPQTVEAYANGLLTSGEYRTTSNQVETRVKGGSGTRVIRDKDGLLLARENIEGGRRIERVDYFINGDPSSITPYQNDHIHGTRLTFALGGLPNTVEQWDYDQQHGITVVYQNGERVSEVPYVHGKRDGIEKKFRDGTILVEEMTWRNDEPHGKRIIYVDGATQVDYFNHGELVSRPTFERRNPQRPNA